MSTFWVGLWLRLLKDGRWKVGEEKGMWKATIEIHLNSMLHVIADGHTSRSSGLACRRSHKTPLASTFTPPGSSRI